MNKLTLYKSKDAQLVSFLAYTEANPNQRFWQQLKNWSGYSFIYGQTEGFILDHNGLKDIDGNEVVLEDTYEL
jgi:hypothetical protein